MKTISAFTEPVIVVYRHVTQCREVFLRLSYEASQIAYQAYFFDNSQGEGGSKMFAHFKVISGKKKWDKMDKKNIPEWFKEYYSSKVAKKNG